MTGRDVRTVASGMSLNRTALAPEFPRSNAERRPRRRRTGDSDRMLLPLPPGEGWGEGTGSDVIPCRAFVAQHLPRFSVWPRKSITLTPGPSPGGRGENRVLILKS